MNSIYVRGAISLLVLAPMVLSAQVARERDGSPLKCPNLAAARIGKGLHSADYPCDLSSRSATGL